MLYNFGRFTNVFPISALQMQCHINGEFHHASAFSKGRTPFLTYEVPVVYSNIKVMTVRRFLPSPYITTTATTMARKIIIIIMITTIFAATTIYSFHISLECNGSQYEKNCVTIDVLVE